MARLTNSLPPGTQVKSALQHYKIWKLGRLLDNKNNTQIRYNEELLYRWIGATWDPQSMKWSKSYMKTCDELHWPTLQLRRQFLICCQVYKIIHKLECIDFSDYLNFTRASCTRSHNLTLFCGQSTNKCF